MTDRDATGTPVFQRRGDLPTFAEDATTAAVLVETLIAWGVTHVFGIVGDGINPIIEALRQRRDRVAFITVRHEESAAFMASAWAKRTGLLGACLATTGPGAAHLVNGLYDAKFDNAPVIAITGSPFHDLEGLRYPQGIDTRLLLQDVADFNQQVTSARHCVSIANEACRAALAGRTVAHLTLAKDVQAQRLAADSPSAEGGRSRTSDWWASPSGAPPMEQLQAAADVLNAGGRTAILAGSGCFGAVPALRATADALGAPIATTYLAKALLPDDDPLTTGGIGHLGTLPSRRAFQDCDTLLILGAMMPWLEYYPEPGRARAVQVDRKPQHIGLKYPVEIGLVGDVGATLDALLPLLVHQEDRSFLREAQRGMHGWNALLDEVARTQRSARIRPQTVVRTISDLAPADAVWSMDAGANTHHAARMIRIREGQLWSGTGTLQTLASGLPYGIASAFAFPGRTNLVVTGDGGLAMLMAELSTAVVNALDVKVLVLNNDAWGQVKFEQQEIGNPNYGIDLGHIDFAGVARATGATGFEVRDLADLEPTMRRFLATPGVALLDVAVDLDVKAEDPQDEAP